MSAETIVGYCRACGKALDQASVQAAQGGIYCKEHVPADAGAPYASPYTSSVPPPIPNSNVSPGGAFVLGLIPGVGAIYNGQYIKGLIHVVILGLLFGIANSGVSESVEPVVVLMIIGFFAYQAFEAFHTAQKRRLGHPVDEMSGLASGTGAARFPAAPVILIALGVVLLLDNLGYLELRRILRFWPVLLIGLGVYMLMNRLGGASSATASSPPASRESQL
jgi:TM2 domain-containing membrane protein YozV